MHWNIEQRLEALFKEFSFLLTVLQLCNTSCLNLLYTAKIMAFYCSVIGTFHTLCCGNLNAHSIAVAMLALDAILFYVLLIASMFEVSVMTEDVIQHIQLVIAKAHLAFKKAVTRVSKEAGMSPCRQDQMWRIWIQYQ